MGEFDGMPDWMVEQIMQKKKALERINTRLPEDHPKMQQFRMDQQHQRSQIVSTVATSENANPVDVDGVPMYGPLADAVHEALRAERDRQIANVKNNIHPQRGQPARDFRTVKLATAAKWKAENE